MTMTPGRSAGRDHAIVLGGSIAGLFAARVLSDSFHRVTIIERDSINDAAEPRKGQAQTRHYHGVLQPTLTFIRNYLPGVEQNLLAGGALVGDYGEFFRWYFFGDYKIRGRVGLEGLSLSRPFLEWQVRRYLSAISNVTLLDQTTAQELILDSDHARIIGVRVTHANSGDMNKDMTADLVVDACGRGSPTPRWLARLGFPVPAEEEVKIRLGYATRLYRRQTAPNKSPEGYVIAMTPPHGKRGAALFPIEDDRWMVTAAGMHGDHPPTEESGFMEFIRSLPTSDIIKVLCDAEPLSDIVPYNFPASRRQRYDRLKHFPDGYLILGDAMASFNPLYGQGMMSATLQVEILGEMMQGLDLTIDWRSFFKRTGKLINQIWQLAVSADFLYPETEGDRYFGVDWVNWYTAQVQYATSRDLEVYRQFVRVIELFASPASLLHPRIAWRVFRASGTISRAKQ